MERKRVYLQAPARIASGFRGFLNELARLFLRVMLGILDRLAHFLTKRPGCAGDTCLCSDDLFTDLTAQLARVGFLLIALVSEKVSFLVLEEQDGGAHLAAD